MARGQKLWDSTARLRVFLQKCCTLSIMLAKLATPLDCPNLGGLRLPGGLTSSKRLFFLVFLGQYSINAIWDSAFWDNAALVLAFSQKCSTVPKFSWFGTSNCWDSTARLLVYLPQYCTVGKIGLLGFLGQYSIFAVRDCFSATQRFCEFSCRHVLLSRSFLGWGHKSFKQDTLLLYCPKVMWASEGDSSKNFGI